jgi:hypothetical protein
MKSRQLRNLLSNLPPDLRIEIEENRSRKDLSETEKIAAIKIVKEHLEPLFARGKPTRGEDSLTLKDLGDFHSVEELAAWLVTGESRTTAVRRAAVLRATEEHPEWSEELLNILTTRGCRAAYSRMKELSGTSRQSKRLVLAVRREDEPLARTVLQHFGEDPVQALSSLLRWVAQRLGLSQSD